MPASQAVHAPEPVTGEKVPGAQGTQAALNAGEKLPAAQFAHPLDAVKPVVDDAVPAGQPPHMVAAMVYVPAGQMTQLDAPVYKETEPAAHAVHAIVAPAAAL